MTKKQKNKAFIKKISTLSIGGKPVKPGGSNPGCPVCGKKVSHAHHITAGPAIKWCPEPEDRHDDSQESSVSE